MDMYMKLGTLPEKRYETREYKTIDEQDIIDVKIQSKWQQVKIWQIYDRIPVLYFGEYI